MSQIKLRTQKEIQKELRIVTLRIHQQFNDEIGSSFLRGIQTALEWVLGRRNSVVADPET